MTKCTWIYQPLVIRPNAGKAPSLSLLDLISSSITFARCCDISFCFRQKCWICPTSWQLQHFGGLLFWAPTSTASSGVSGFDSWTLSFRSWWISYCWTKSNVRSSTRASRAATKFENDGGRLPRRVTTWSSSVIGAPIELSLSVSSFIFSMHINRVPFSYLLLKVLLLKKWFVGQSFSLKILFKRIPGLFGCSQEVMR